MQESGAAAVSVTWFSGDLDFTHKDTKKASYSIRIPTKVMPNRSKVKPQQQQQKAI